MRGSARRPAAYLAACSTGGLLFFDYVKSDATGLDTIPGRDQRLAVFTYVRNNFEILHGSLNEDRSIGLTIVAPR